MIKNEGTLSTIKGDVTNPQGEGYIIIPHVCNDLGIIGAGVAKALKDKWSDVFTVYAGAINSLKKEERLGTCSFVDVETKENKIIKVANMVAQNDLRSQDNSKPLKYRALVKCMELVLEEAFCYEKVFEKGQIASIHAPKFGSFLAQGNWNFILELIKEI